MTASSPVFNAIFCFRAASTTSLLVLLYAAIFISLYITDQLPSVPSVDYLHGRGVNFEQTYKDLHLISARPHPYNSRENDRVRSYILNRVSEIAKGHDHVTIDDDTETTVSFTDGAHATYFEGTNILIKIHGSAELSEQNAVLFSAHLDSVSTGFGATDDGMSVSALIQMVQYLATHRPLRTAVFNLNNGEEDGLNGAHAFLGHPWANLTSTFLNFEGAGAGGRPLLFRATTLAELKAFAYVPHPHANALTGDAFSRGIVRSETDYAVYSGPRSHFHPQEESGSRRSENGAQTSAYKGPGGGMRGADVAFYRRRSRYHTPGDTVRGMGRDGARKALWAMIEVVHGAGGALLNAERGDLHRNVGVDEKGGAVYFELFARYLVAFPLRLLLAGHIVLLFGGPILVAAILAFLQSRPHFAFARAVELRNRWTDGLRGYGRFILALLTMTGAQVCLVVGYIKFNPYTIYAHDLATTLSMFSLSYLSIVIPLSLAARMRPISPSRQKLIVLFEIYVFTWALLVGATILTQRANITGVYWVGAWNASALLAFVIVSYEGLSGVRKVGIKASTGRPAAEGLEDDEGDRAGSAPAGEGGSLGNVEQLPEEDEDNSSNTDTQEREIETSESTPLIGRRPHKSSSKSEEAIDEGVQDRAFFWWILEVLASIPVPVVLLGTIAFLWVGAMSQTVVDGGWVGIVYAPLSLLSVLISIPLAPFAHQTHRMLTIFMLVIFIASTAYSWLMWPFDTDDARCKIFFGHRVELQNISASIDAPHFGESYAHSPHALRAVTELRGVPGYVERVVEALPSSWGGDAQVHCEDNPNKQRTCSWELDQSLMPAPAFISNAPLRIKQADDGQQLARPQYERIPDKIIAQEEVWIYFNATRLDSLSARFLIRGTNTRSCGIHLDGRDIRRYRVLLTPGSFENGSNKEEWHEYDVPKGVNIREVRLWSRKWGRTFQIEVEWSESEGGDGNEAVEGRITCSWAEYQGMWAAGFGSDFRGSATTISNPPGGVSTSGVGAHIPALEEALAFFPEWATITKMRDGLVQAVIGFKL
ncbi:hypothetical protein EW146_g874 [Bondarzewia mesenterica]|uniref:Peptide hydrolase n=1 Tax=Bondarzewia mesenterica TaxID=1095465 RepID=A0A4S4M7G6_9AGAM|nr:hypothetical protein EW146_g874 [Bondarzewia mesenterica]